MYSNSEKKLALVAAWSFVLTGFVCVSQRLNAEESAKVDAPKCPCQLRIEMRGKIPFLEKIPLVKYLVPQVEASACQDLEIDHLERIGVDFDLIPGHMVAMLPNGERQVICTEKDCSMCGATQCAGTQKNCSKEACETCPAIDAVVGDHEAKFAFQCTNLEQVCSGNHADVLSARVAELQSENTGLRAEYEATRATLEARNEMFEKLLELTAKNARLVAELEFQQERNELRDEMTNIVHENGRLKIAAEIAEERNALLKQSTQVALENERLKLRIAELERHHDAERQGPRTAKKPRSVK